MFTQGFFADEGLDFETRIALGQCASGAADAGEVLSTIARVTDEGSWFREFCATAARVQAGAEASAKQGHPVSAGSAYLRAAGYWAMAMGGLVGADGGATLTKTFRAHQDCWDGFIEASRSRFVPVSVPYEGTALPGWLLRPDDSGRPRPTLVMTN
ncbi:MAG: alpha/beta hydrolase family protein, partial [Mycobacteriaceae bacterium]